MPHQGFVASGKREAAARPRAARQVVKALGAAAAQSEKLDGALGLDPASRRASSGPRDRLAMAEARVQAALVSVCAALQDISAFALEPPRPTGRGSSRAG